MSYFLPWTAFFERGGVTVGRRSPSKVSSPTQATPSHWEKKVEREEGEGNAPAAYVYFGFFSAGLRIWNEHSSVSSTLIIAPALSN